MTDMCYKAPRLWIVPGRDLIQFVREQPTMHPELTHTYTVHVQTTPQRNRSALTGLEAELSIASFSPSTLGDHLHLQGAIRLKRQPTTVDCDVCWHPDNRTIVLWTRLMP